MDCLFELIVQLLGELLLGGFFELIGEVIGRFVGWLFRLILGPAADTRIDLNPRRVGRIVLWLLAGVACGFLSLLILPAAFVKVPALHAVNLVLTPFLMAALTVQAGRLLPRKRP